MQWCGANRLPAVIAACLVALPATGIAESAGPARGNPVPEQVSLIVEGKRLLASNIRLNRIDPLQLAADETVQRQVDARAALAVATDQRVLAYGPVIGWRSMDLDPGEQVERLQAEDFAVFIITNRRYLNFNANSGIWGSTARAGD